MSKMPPQPEAMKRTGRAGIEAFHQEEVLFRRVPTSIWPSADAPIPLDAIILPDISMARSSLGHPEWLRLDLHANIFRKNWGVIGVLVRHIPITYQLDGGPLFSYRVQHAPLENDYPHSEVQAFDGERHLDTRESVPEDLHLEWRANLLEAFNTYIRPSEQWAIRNAPPKSYVPEPHPDRKD